MWPFFDLFPGAVIVGEGVELPKRKFPNGGPTIFAEFFGDIMLVNGKIWPKVNVDPREYRLRLLNGCDSRTLVIDFVRRKLWNCFYCLVVTLLLSLY